MIENLACEDTRDNTYESRKMIQEAGCDVGTKRIVWVKVNPDYEILFRLMDGLYPEAGRRYWIREHGAEVDIKSEIALLELSDRFAERVGILS